MPLEPDLSPEPGASVEADLRDAELAARLADLGNERFLRAVVRDPVRFHHRSTECLTGRPTAAPEVTEPTSSLPADERLPERWTLADIQRLKGCPEARLLDIIGAVTCDGVRLRADRVIDLAGLCAVRTVSGDWYLGDLISEAGGVDSWEKCGPDLGVALRSL
ncbi:hypothetical protein AB0K43_00415 [Kitasatospora sp. NPDC049258]|uniref:hypothetical protein n=1 Tax=Kitasatospora sp. NPDC049258 TaxID=3155394 RepID=UPI00342977C4